MLILLLYLILILLYLVASNIVLIVDEWSKKLIIDPNYNEEPDDNKNDGDSKNVISGIFNNKFSSL